MASSAWRLLSGSTACCSGEQIHLNSLTAELFDPEHNGSVDLLTHLTLFLREGADPNLELEDGSRLLHVAVLQNRLDVAAALLDSGALPDLPDLRRDTPLHLACKQARQLNSEPMVKLLLARAADPNQLGDGGDTPLHWACRAGVYEVVVALLLSGADPGSTNEQGQSCREVVAVSSSSYAEIAKLLTASVSARDHPSASPRTSGPDRLSC